jgi:Ni,Fe-hydrogenase III small subunit
MRQYYKKGSFPDLNKDGKITKADVLMGRGVIGKKKKKKIKRKMAKTPMDKMVRKS